MKFRVIWWIAFAFAYAQQVYAARRLFDGLSNPNAVHRVLQHARFDMAQRRDFTGRAIGGFLNHMAGVPLRPVPFNLVPRARFVKTLPPFEVFLATKAAHHSLNYITRVGVQTHATRFFQGFEAESRRGNFSLLICGPAEIQTERTPQPFVAEQRHRRRARFITAVSEAGTVTGISDNIRSIVKLIICYI